MTASSNLKERKKEGRTEGRGGRMEGRKGRDGTNERTNEI
jgi:hypothetical protein